MKKGSNTLIMELHKAQPTSISIDCMENQVKKSKKDGAGTRQRSAKITHKLKLVARS